MKAHLSNHVAHVDGGVDGILADAVDVSQKVLCALDGPGSLVGRVHGLNTHRNIAVVLCDAADFRQQL